MALCALSTLSFSYGACVDGECAGSECVGMELVYSRTSSIDRLCFSPSWYMRRTGCSLTSMAVSCGGGVLAAWPFTGAG